MWSEDDCCIGRHNSEKCPYCMGPTKSLSMSSISEKKPIFGELLSTIYNYRLPSALHQPDEFLQESYLPLLQSLSISNEPENQKKGPPLMRPRVPDKLCAFMDSVKAEMDICNYDKTHQELVAETMTRKIPEPCYGEWENASVQYKLKLADKAGTQQRYVDIIGTSCSILFVSKLIKI